MPVLKIKWTWQDAVALKKLPYLSGAGLGSNFLLAACLVLKIEFLALPLRTYFRIIPLAEMIARLSLSKNASRAE